MKNVQGLLIDPVAKTAESITFAPTLEEFYRLLKCDEISGAYLFDENVSTTIVEAMPHTFAVPELRGIPCTLAEGWAQPIGGPFIVTGPIDHEGEHTSINPAQVEAIVARLNAYTLRVVADDLRYYNRGSYALRFAASLS